MSLSIFGEKALMPTDEMLAEALQQSQGAWTALQRHMAETYGPVSGEWKYYEKPSGWTFALKSGKRALLYFIPQEKAFKVNFVFGEKALLAARTAGLPEAVLTAIAEAKAYREGRPFMVDVAGEADIPVIKTLLKIKAAN